MQQLKQEAAALIADALRTHFPEAALPEEDLASLLEYPPDAAMGDLAFPCFRLSKSLRMAPPKIAQQLSDMPLTPAFSEIRAVGGYLNFTLASEALLARVTQTIRAQGKHYGSHGTGKGKTVVLDYSSPNVAKPFHIGHLGTTVIGHSLKLLHAFEGYDCVGINHLGDWGTQFGKLICAYRAWGDRAQIEREGIDGLVALYVRFHKEAEENEALNDEARREFTKLEQGDAENLELWRWFIAISLTEYQKTYGMLDITFDSYNGESFYTDKMPEQIQALRDKQLLELDDGASVVNLEEWGMPPCLILKRDGSTLYPTRDIAAAVYRKRTYDFDRCIYVTSAGQSLHFAQWFKVVERMGYDWFDKLVHVPYGTVSIHGEKLATRTGNVILLKDLFAQAIEKAGAITAEKNPELAGRSDIAEAVGVGAIVFHYLSNNRMRDMNFVLEDALSFDGNTGPYAQYTFARTCSILEKAPALTEATASDKSSEEKELVKVLARFPDAVAEALAQYEPSVITRYILDLCGAFNRFYHNCRILDEKDPARRNTRLLLTSCTNTVLDTALSLICMKRPQKI